MIIVAGVVVVVAGCLGAPQMLSRPVTAPAGALDCVGATLVELGYTITDGDRATGFIKGERQEGLGFFSTPETYILSVSETASGASVPQLNVTASRRRADDKKGRVVIGPSDEGLADAEQLLESCAGVR